MKKLRPLMAALLVLAAGAPRANLLHTINVTTTSDDDGTNPATCSLREAVKAANDKADYGGCAAGTAFDDYLIQLKPGHYVLTRGELTVSGEMTIAGSDKEQEAHDAAKDPLTGKAPRRFRPDYLDTVKGETGTYIASSPASRIFLASGSLSLRDLVLDGSASPAQAAPAAVAGNGGVIFTNAPLSLSNVIARGGKVSGASLASGNGGAIFLAGDGSGLNLTDVTLDGNQAEGKGGAIAMSCRVGLTPYAAHSISITRSLLRDNAAQGGAGVIDACGDTSVTLNASTLAANSSASGSAAISYVQGSNVGVGQVALNYVTAAEQKGHVLALNGMATITLNSNLLAAFADTVGAAAVCYNPDLATVGWSSSPYGSGSFNAITADGSCTPLLGINSGNVDIATTANLSDMLVPIMRPVDYYPATVTGKPYGLTDYYLPKVGAPVIDAGEALGACVIPDQRNVTRNSGTACDIGAIERLVLTPRDDTGENARNTARKGVIDVLANDSIGEDDVTGPGTLAANTPDDPATPASDAKPAVQLVSNPDNHCSWNLSNAAEYPGMLVVQNDGELTPDGSPIVCTYKVLDGNGVPSATTATVTVKIRNASPNAVDDAYLRPVGTASITFNPMSNDNDDGDGQYGRVLLSSTPVKVFGTEPDWDTTFPIEIVTTPELGKIVGSSSGQCPGATSSSPKVCVTPPLTYVADNSQAPFTDSFTYRVYDKDGGSSAPATVSVYTDAPDPDHGGAGSVDLLGGLLLSLLGLRRFLRL